MIKFKNEKNWSERNPSVNVWFICHWRVFSSGAENITGKTVPVAPIRIQAQLQNIAANDLNISYFSIGFIFLRFLELQVYQKITKKKFLLKIPELMEYILCYSRPCRCQQWPEMSQVDLTECRKWETLDWSESSKRLKSNPINNASSTPGPLVQRSFSLIFVRFL